MFNNVKRKIVSVLTLTLLLSSCGGGGGGGGSDSGSSAVSGFNVTGAVSIPSFTIVDSDVGDSEIASVDNSTIFNPQSVPNPASIGGYLRFSNPNIDRDDYFKVSLKKDQSILLNIADSSSIDFDLYLYNLSGTLILSSTGSSKTEQIAVPADGDYLVNVTAINGAANYVLSIGLKQNAHVIDGVVQFNPYTEPAADFDLQQMVVKKRASFSVSQYLAGQNIESKAELVDIESPAGDLENIVLSDAVMAKITQGTTALQQKKLATLYKINVLAHSDDIEYAHPNLIRTVMRTPNDTLYPLQWHYPMINLPAAWDITTGNTNVIVAVIDTGVYLNHEDLVGQLVGGYDFISNVASAKDGDGIDANPDDVGDGLSNVASSYHGTHVAGTIAALSNNNKGVAGVSWGAKIMPIRVLGAFGGTDYDIAQGIRFAAGLANDSNTVPPQRADIINMSLGGVGASQVLLDAVNAARNAGVIIVAAAGNAGTSTRNYPAAFGGVISVSALDAAQKLAPYSSFGNTIDIAAPGGNVNADIAGDGRPDGVLSTMSNDSRESLVAFYQGTSMAAPHVAGVLALMKSIKPSLTPADADNLLQTGGLSRDIGVAGRDNLYGYGILDARKALESTNGAVAGAASLNVYPQSLNFTVIQSTHSLEVSKSTLEALTVTSVTSSQPWLTVVEPSSGFGTYTVYVDKSSLSDGIHTAKIVMVSDTGGTRTIEIIVQVSANGLNGNVGRSYVLLIDSKTGSVAKQFNINNALGQIEFDFSGVAVGTYNLIVGTDMDNDNIICDEGEACGGYPTLNQLADISITGNKGDLNFAISFAESVIGSLNANAELLEQDSIEKSREGYQLIQ